MAQYLLGIDIGTSGTKTVLFHTDGSVAASATFEYPLYQPENGWAEQAPEDWWQGASSTCKQVIEKSGVDAADIKGVGLTGQMHGLVMLDKDNAVIRKSIIWCDGRTGKECAEITERVGANALMEITANPALAGFTASKILWVRNNEPENYARCRHILLPKDYIRFMLTGEYATDVSDASGMQLMNIKQRAWSPEVLKALEIDPALLAKLYESPEISGYVTEAAARLTGLKAGTPVVAGAGDNAAAAVGVGVIKDGSAFTTIGTSGVVFAHSSKYALDPLGRVHTFCCAVPGAWHMMGVTQAAGLSLQWFRNNFCEDYMERAKLADCDPYYLMDIAAADVPIGCNRLLFLPYLMGERTPHLDPDCRGAFFGLSAIHTKEDLLRAVMEGVTYSLKDCYDIIRGLGVNAALMLACGGGGKSKLWRQMLADVYDCGVATIAANEGPASGAAILAGVGVGVFRNVEEACNAIVKQSGVQAPIKENTEKYAKIHALYDGLYPALKDCYQQLKQL